MKRRRASVLATLRTRASQLAAQTEAPVIGAAGLCVKAEDTGRVLLHQRALDDDNAPGKWEFPGGHVDPGEDPFDAACREFKEETGLAVPDGGALAAAEVAEAGAFILFVLCVPEEFELVGGQEEEGGIGNVAWFDPVDVEDSDILREEAKTNDWDAIKEATMKPAVTTAVPGSVPALATVPAPPAEPDDATALTAWTDADTAVLCFVTDAAVAQTGFDPAADPPMFVPIGAVADLDQPSVKAAISATLTLDDEEDEAEAPDTDTGGPEMFVLVWGDPTKPENLTAFPEDADEATEPEQAEAAAEAMPAMGLATGVPPEAPNAEPMPDEERTIPVPGPLGMFEACLVTEGVATDEVFETDESGSVVMGRLIPEGVLTWRTPPLPGGFAVNDVGSPADNGHMGAPVACAATEIVREGNRIMARGPYLDNADGAALKAAVDGGAPIAPSIDLGASDQWEITTEADGTSRRTLVAGSIAGFVVLPYEAQHSTESGEWLTWFRSAPDTALTPPEAMPDEMPALVPVAASAAPVTWESLVACGAGNSAPVHPPAEWFQPPVMDGPTALHVTEEGQVWGHLAGPGCHIGIPDQCVTVAGATSKDFTEFHHGPDDGQGIVLADGSRIRVGALTLAGGHADLRASAREAKAHYDESRSVVAFLRAGWDEKNNLPYIAGSVLPNVPEDKMQILRGLGQSGDWREPDGSDWRAQEVWRTVDGKPTLIAATVVPVDGFPKMRRALAAGGFIEAEIVDTALALGTEACQTAACATAPTPSAADGLILEIGRDLYLRKFGEEAALLASAHAEERDRLGALMR